MHSSKGIRSELDDAIGGASVCSVFQPSVSTQWYALGNERFKEEIEELTGRRLKPKKVGRPVGWRKKKPSE